ncbi:MAG: 5-oxoprolinase subunit PxpB [Porticoccaceae bacterium]
MNGDFPKVIIASENSSIVYFSDRPCAKTSSQISHTAKQLKNSLKNQLIDLVPSYNSILVIYNAFDIDHLTIEKEIHRAIAMWTPEKQASIGKSIELPVYYSIESGPDLKRLADHTNLTIDELISIHYQTEYTVYAMGFAPGFAYLGETDSRIAIPRLDTPRSHVPKGSVAIADRQTAIYPSQSPGGWNLIGLCPSVMFDPNQKPSTLVEVGDKVKFKPIDRTQFLQLGGLEDLLSSPNQ